MKPRADGEELLYALRCSHVFHETCLADCCRAFKLHIDHLKCPICKLVDPSQTIAAQAASSGITRDAAGRPFISPVVSPVVVSADEGSPHTDADDDAIDDAETELADAFDLMFNTVDSEDDAIPPGQNTPRRSSKSRASPKAAPGSDDDGAHASPKAKSKARAKAKAAAAAGSAGLAPTAKAKARAMAKAAAGDAGSEAAPKAKSKARAKAKAAAGDDGSQEAEPTADAELEAEVVVESNTSSRTLIGGGIP